LVDFVVELEDGKASRPIATDFGQRTHLILGVINNPGEAVVHSGLHAEHGVRAGNCWLAIDSEAALVLGNCFLMGRGISAVFE
jgi:hypothetical protein